MLTNSDSLSSKTVFAMCLTRPSPCDMISEFDAQATSISACQNSVRCLRVLLFSARNEGAIVYNLSRAGIAASAYNCQDWVRYAFFPKYGTSNNVDPPSTAPATKFGA